MLKKISEYYGSANQIMIGLFCQLSIVGTHILSYYNIHEHFYVFQPSVTSVHIVIKDFRQRGSLETMLDIMVSADNTQIVIKENRIGGVIECGRLGFEPRSGQTLSVVDWGSSPGQVKP